MIDGWFKTNIDPLWERAAVPLARSGISANQVTMGGLILISASSALFVWHQSTLLYGIMLAFCFASDALDGAVARLRNEASHWGGYLDALVDRYQELIVFLAIALVTGQDQAVLLALSGSFLTSYAKARAAIEVPVNNVEWPDLFERLERIIYLCGALILDGLVREFTQATFVLPVALWLLAAATHVTALQRMGRAYRLLKAGDRSVGDAATDRAASPL